MDQDELDRRAELISRMFALITGKLEDGATIAAESQGRVPLDELRGNAEKLQDLLAECIVVVDGAAALLV